MSLLLVVLVVTIIFYSYYLLSGPTRALSHIPGPRGHLLFGDVKEERSLAYSQIQVWKHEHGPIFKYFYGRLPRVVITDPNLVHEVCHTQFDNFVNRPYPVIRLRQSSGLLMSRDDYWKRMRRTVSPTFNSIHLRQMIVMVNDAADVFEKKMAGIARQSTTVDVHSALSRLTLEIIGTTAFGTHFPSQEKDDDPLSLAAAAFFRLSSGSNGSFQYAGALCPPLASAFAAIFKIFQPKAVRGILASVRTLHNQAQGIIQERRAHPHTEDKDFVDLLIHSKDENTGRQLTDSEIRDQCNTFLLAGHDTTANALAYTVYLVSQHPDVEEKMLAEIDKVFGGKNPSSLDELKGLEYTSMVLNESLRLFPPAPIFARECKDNIELGGYIIPAGTAVVVHAWNMHKDPALWGHDADQFNPDRWAQGPPHACAFLPFGTGPRGCVGMRFALMEAKIILARIYQKFTFKLIPGQVPLKTRTGIVMTPENGILVQVSPRHS